MGSTNKQKEYGEKTATENYDDFFDVDKTWKWRRSVKFVIYISFSFE